MDKQQTAAFLKRIVGAYPNFEPTPARMQVWEEMMADISYDLAAQRLKHYMAISRFPPSIADILNPEAANRKRQQPESETQSVHAILYGGFEVYDPEKH